MEGQHDQADRYQPAGRRVEERPEVRGETRQRAETYATLAYEDNKGRQSYRMTKNQIVIGRGGRDYWTDLTLETVPDVSREHIRLRRDPATGKFFVKDLSRLGTTIDGRKIPSSVEYAGDEKKDKNLEVDLPVARADWLGRCRFSGLSSWQRMKTIYFARYFFIGGLLLLAGGLAWVNVFRAHRK